MEIEDTTDRVYRIQLSEGSVPLADWLCQYGREVFPDELYRLIHYKHQTLPNDQFIVWANQALMGRHSGWILKDITSVRVLWHSLGETRGTEGWYFIGKTFALPFTDAPVF
ncbi:MAG: hypothetical protein DRP83_00760 [Planctomycetota bacterium]|nr:MAG: hypothetical protein DRP83_00760 [Planctomycetota bacterium]